MSRKRYSIGCHFTLEMNRHAEVFLLGINTLTIGHRSVEKSRSSLSCETASRIRRFTQLNWRHCISVHRLRSFVRLCCRLSQLSTVLFFALGDTSCKLPWARHHPHDGICPGLDDLAPSQGHGCMCCTAFFFPFRIHDHCWKLV